MGRQGEMHLLAWVQPEQAVAVQRVTMGPHGGFSRARIQIEAHGEHPPGLGAQAVQASIDLDPIQLQGGQGKGEQATAHGTPIELQELQIQTQATHHILQLFHAGQGKLRADRRPGRPALGIPWKLVGPKGVEWVVRTHESQASGSQNFAFFECGTLIGSVKILSELLIPPSGCSSDLP